MIYFFWYLCIGFVLGWRARAWFVVWRVERRMAAAWAKLHGPEDDS